MKVMNGLGCVPLGGSGSGFVIQDHLDQGVPKERDFGSYDQLP